jgi:hypothetical protein
VVTAALDGLLAELDAWGDAGTAATLWWRDDDAIDATPALDRLLAEAAGVPLGLAVVPMEATAALVRRLAAGSGAVPGVLDVLQHGHAHANHAPLGGKKAEFTAGRLEPAMAAEVAEGFARLTALFGPRFVPVFVPPWNRFPHDLVPCLVAVGHRVLSTYGPRQAPMAALGLRQVNTHVDVTDWRTTRTFIGGDRLARGIALHLAARRAGTVDADEPTGLLTHHLDLEAGDLAAIGAVVRRIAAHPAARWLPAGSFAAADVPVDECPATR